jgi:hypothetical protein
MVKGKKIGITGDPAYVFDEVCIKGNDLRD